MNKFKCFSLAASALLLFSACSKDDDNATAFQPQGTYNGTFATSAAGSPYATDKTNTKIEINNDSILTLTIGEVTGSPAAGNRPATKMNSMTLKNIHYKKVNGKTITFSSASASGKGVMAGHEFDLNNSSLSEGKIEGNKLSYKFSFKFGKMPFNIDATFKGVKAEK